MRPLFKTPAGGPGAGVSSAPCALDSISLSFSISLSLSLSYYLSIYFPTVYWLPPQPGVSLPNRGAARMLLAHALLGVPKRHASTGLARLESGTAPPAVPSTTWALDQRIADRSGLLSCPDGQRNAAESECLAAVQEAVRAFGMLVRGIDVVNVGADGVVPGGCSYSRKSKKALFNTNSAGRFGFGHEKYALVCMVAGTAAAPRADASPTASHGPPTASEGPAAGSRALSFAPSGAGCPDGQRNAAESECLAAVQEAVRAFGMLVRGIDVVNVGADGVVPGGCSYSRKSKKALFNTDAAGGRFGNDRYDFACVIGGRAAAPGWHDAWGVRHPGAPPTPADGPGSPSASVGAGAAARTLGFVPSGGWGNQMVGLQHALFFAKAIERTLLVPRVMDHYDVRRKAWSNMTNPHNPHNPHHPHHPHHPHNPKPDPNPNPNPDPNPGPEPNQAWSNVTCSGGAYDQRDVRDQLSIYQAVLTTDYLLLTTDY